MRRIYLALDRASRGGLAAVILAAIVTAAIGGAGVLGTVLGRAVYDLILN